MTKNKLKNKCNKTKRMKLQGNNNKKSIKQKNRAIKSRGTKPDKKIKLNKMPKDKNWNKSKLQKGSKAK